MVRDKSFLIPLIGLAVALVFLALDWMFGDAASDETVIYAVLAAGAVALFVVRWGLIVNRGSQSKGRAHDD